MKNDLINLIFFTLIYIIVIIILVIEYRKDRQYFVDKPEKVPVFVLIIGGITILWFFGAVWIIDSIMSKV